MYQMEWLNKTLTKLWPFIDQVGVGVVLFVSQQFTYDDMAALLIWNSDSNYISRELLVLVLTIFY